MDDRRPTFQRRLLFGYEPDAVDRVLDQSAARVHRIAGELDRERRQRRELEHELDRTRRSLERSGPREGHDPRPAGSSAEAEDGIDRLRRSLFGVHRGDAAALVESLRAARTRCGELEQELERARIERARHERERDGIEQLRLDAATEAARIESAAAATARRLIEAAQDNAAAIERRALRDADRRRAKLAAEIAAERRRAAELQAWRHGASRSLRQALVAFDDLLARDDAPATLDAPSSSRPDPAVDAARPVEAAPIAPAEPPSPATSAKVEVRLHGVGDFAELARVTRRLTDAERIDAVAVLDYDERVARVVVHAGPDVDVERVLELPWLERIIEADPGVPAFRVVADATSVTAS